MSRPLRISLAIVLYAGLIVAADLAGTALHPRHANAVSIPPGACPLITTTVRDGRTIVTYADDTRNARMGAAIRTAVMNWNQALGDVELVPDENFAAVSFRAGARNKVIPDCSSSAARTLVITLSTPLWAATSGPKVVSDPVGSMAKDVGLALGLPAGGKCPDVMAPVVCSHRDAFPSSNDAAVVRALYAHKRQ